MKIVAAAESVDARSPLGELRRDTRPPGSVSQNTASTRLVVETEMPRKKPRVRKWRDGDWISAEEFGKMFKQLDDETEYHSSWMQHGSSNFRRCHVIENLVRWAGFSHMHNEKSKTFCTRWKTKFAVVKGVQDAYCALVDHESISKKSLQG